MTEAFRSTDIVLTGLQLTTSYDVYLVAEDVQIPATIQGSLASLTTSTSDTIDDSPPQWISTFPQLQSTSHSSILVDVATDEVCDIFVVVS